MKKKKIRFLVLGSNSFSGSNFINLLLKNFHFTIGLSRSKELNKVFLPYKYSRNKNLFKFFKIDINKKKNILKIIRLIKKFRITHVVNFASQSMVAESWNRPIDWYRTNIIAQIEFHEELRKIKFLKKYIHISTPEVYGDTQGIIKENTFYKPSTPYAVSRAACDMHLLSFFKNYNFPVIFTRAANVYGPCQQLYRIVPKTILSLKKKKKLFLHGGGYSKRSFIFIDDAMQATYKVCLSGKIGSIYHISTNHRIRIKDLVRKIFKLTKNLDKKKSSDYLMKKYIISTKDRPGKDKLYGLDSRKIEKELKWHPKVSIDGGLKKTIDWIDDNLSYLKNLSMEYTHKK